MKYSLDFRIIHSTEAKCQEALDALPLPTDTGVTESLFETTNPTQYYPDLGETLNGYISNAMVRFETEAGRETYWTVITAILDIIQGCEVGTKVAKHVCNHDGDSEAIVNPDGVTKGCYEEVIYEVI